MGVRLRYGVDLIRPEGSDGHRGPLLLRLSLNNHPTLRRRFARVKPPGGEGAKGLEIDGCRGGKAPAQHPLASQPVDQAGLGGRVEAVVGPGGLRCAILCSVPAVVPSCWSEVERHERKESEKGGRGVAGRDDEDRPS